MNSEVPQIPESEPTKEPANLGSSSDAIDDWNDVGEVAQSISEDPESLADMWQEEDEKIIDTSVEENITELPGSAVELISDENLAEESGSSLEGLEVTLESSPQEISEPELVPTEVVPEQKKPELFTDTWLDESLNIEESAGSSTINEQTEEFTSQIADLEQKKASLIEEIRLLEIRREEAISQQAQYLQRTLEQMLEEGMAELRERKNNTLIDIEKLERRRERIHQEMRTNFAGASQDLAVRIQGFKEYLVGSLQDLVTAAEQLELAEKETPAPSREARGNRDTRDNRGLRASRDARDRGAKGSRDTRSGEQSPRRGQRSSPAQFTDQAFADQTRKISQILEQYRTSPDYYGPPWQLRRTFEPIHEERVKDWFFVKGGRGAIKGVGSRLQNILVTAAVISILYRLYRDRCRILVLVDTPEKLGEWRRGLQDCLGISRGDFGSNRGVVLFESADVLVQRAERLLQDKLLPLIIIDETEELVNLSLLKFPLWLAFAAESQSKTTGYLY
ncbi:Protein of unknown function (DUF3086) [Xenococcus sp. PCC 7305]|uniref:DUF3086 domain-containing protein n=1 Tax=Xenococcus sp. PCC 7305 TaxID=102125 RepID=UPI0002AC8F72|nr:DUF3086 domain-containing protein [Xenococcus sp. PCC 7305]ELS05469.1 Protein of unknown function (DUF3086) [Xenococcus sp. PCC 7305]